MVTTNLFLDACKILNEAPERFKNLVQFIGSREGIRRVDFEDFFHEVFQRLWRKCRILEAKSDEHLKGIFCKTARRLAKDHREKKQNQQIVGLEPAHLERSASENVDSRQHLPDLDREMLQQQLEALPEPRRTILRLRVVEELKFREISERCGLTLSAVYEHYVQVIKTLKERLTA